MEKYGDYLSKNGIRPSTPRLLIYKYLFENHNHPTADTIYMALSPSIPSLSKTTVYNTLKLFVSKGVAKSLTIEENEARYDVDTSVHGHFKCKSCGGLFDVLTSPENLNISGLDGFQIDEYQINLKGFCKVCKPN
ncbi:MAG: Fur family transcriptional regulator [Prolixibacteraceae bacterium]